LRQGGARLPRQPDDAEPCAHEVSEDAREQPVGWEVSEEAGMLPVRNSGQDEPIDVCRDYLEGLASLWRFLGKCARDIARRHPGHDGALANMRTIVRDPVDDAMAGFAEFLWSHAGAG